MALAKILEIIIGRFTERQTTRAKVSGDVRDDQRDDFDTVTDKLGSYVTMIREDYEREHERRVAVETKLDALKATQDETNQELRQLRIQTRVLLDAIRELPIRLAACSGMAEGKPCPGNSWAAGMLKLFSKEGERDG
jgi:hypothetical protein